MTVSENEKEISCGIIVDKILEGASISESLTSVNEVDIYLNDDEIKDILQSISTDDLKEALEGTDFEITDVQITPTKYGIKVYVQADAEDADGIPYIAEFDHEFSTLEEIFDWDSGMTKEDIIQCITDAVIEGLSFD